MLLVRLLVVIVGLAIAFGEGNLRASTSSFQESPLRLHEHLKSLKTLVTSGETVEVTDFVETEGITTLASEVSGPNYLFFGPCDGVGTSFILRIGLCIGGDGEWDKYNRLEMKPDNKFSVRHQTFSDPGCSEPKGKATVLTMVNGGCSDNMRISAGPYTKTKELVAGAAKLASINRGEKACEKDSFDYGFHVPLNVCIDSAIVTGCLPNSYGLKWSGVYFDYYDNEGCQGQRVANERYVPGRCIHYDGGVDDTYDYKRVCTSGPIPR